MVKFGTVSPPPPPPPTLSPPLQRPPPPLPPPRTTPSPAPPPPPFRFGLIEHQAKEAYEKDKMEKYLQNQNQESQSVIQDHRLTFLPKTTKPDQEQYLHNHEHTGSKPGMIELIEGSGTTRHDWVISIRDKLEQANRHDDRTSWGKLCIYKVPHYLCKDEKKSYFPDVVSIGPYHHGQEQTRSMECHKWRAVNKVLKRTMQDIELFIDAMSKLEEKSRACYEGTISLNSNEFTEMFLLDGCFVLEFLRGVTDTGGFSKLG